MLTNPKDLKKRLQEKEPENPQKTVMK